ncbi:hypothetical protein [Campylobacter mucosalis]|uniref:Uncharacterized protein n=1 Tax=Campylobacter mucosalis CCUG 21559 TaxID=1032067 RepID=A0A6G5QFL9_9BACT|nr:hypothetical protein [Campylobacter mucosalis]QCD44470.1 hypothetical protein CMUC_0671 [Campylobacter mucosalis CCUG 21559]
MRDYQTYGKTQDEIYQIGLKALKSELKRELETKKARLKNELLNALNEPMHPATFKQIADDLYNTLNELLKFKD